METPSSFDYSEYRQKAKELWMYAHLKFSHPNSKEVQRAWEEMVELTADTVIASEGDLAIFEEFNDIDGRVGKVADFATVENTIASFYQAVISAMGKKLKPAKENRPVDKTRGEAADEIGKAAKF